MRDLNDLLFFTEVVAHGGFAAAGRALREPKSKLSRRVASLEARLGVRLIERSSRRFQVTEVGRAFYAQCRVAMAEVERAEALVQETQGEPHGLVRFSSPLGLMEPLAPLIAGFLSRHPRVRLHVVATNRRVDLIDERIDVALRVRAELDSDAALTLRTLGTSRRILVASPAFVNAREPLSEVEQLAALPTLSATEQQGTDRWALVGPTGQQRVLEHEPLLACGDFGALRDAAVAGAGVALLPDHACAAALKAGQLVRVLHPWHAVDGIVHVVFTTRRGLPPPVRAWIDHLAAHFGETQVLSPALPT
ncbi:LysR family transcriptional regulator [Aggregicoccus sp. 17bor-14]|uniref:LysR substrate-binding domain-containing protein n=1 Tax=Myxococcaceae TaxID=31 RepID=UPI00129C351E|nr:MULTISPECIES: LysR substrate-binding domain-containing protein [Myxococcaceae]MBF5043318.1 LysR family transcriptional regulator [Simulacricoccus sp. 17bor-14]MRI89077.1 LysR family transcriptional regulator [Aggregicoccus sp. 17bor-14]